MLAKRTIVMFASVHSSLKESESSSYRMSIEAIEIPIDQWEIKIIVIEAENKSILENFKFLVVGTLLCYRHNDEELLNIISLDGDTKKNQNIDLSHIFETNQEFKNQTTFDRISKNSFISHRLKP